MRRGAPALLLFAALACGGGPRAAVDDAVRARELEGALEAYDQFREADGADGALLAEVAALLLELEALGEDESRRDAALTQLRLAGNAALPVLERIGRSEGETVARAEALAHLTRRGDGEARAYLYALLDTDDPAILAPALVAVDPEEETARLVAWLADPIPEVRRAAALRLGAATESREALGALRELARVDPEPRVRGAAIRALGGFGAAVFEALRERLGGAASNVRLATVRALVRADRPRAVAALRSLLATPPNPAGIEAARVIALTGNPEEEDAPPEEGVVDARAYLRGALGSADPTLRSQAAVALVSLPADEGTDAALLAALDGEADASVRLGMARALLGHEGAEEEARETLRALMEGEGMAAVQAAALLAKEGEDAALTRLEAALEAESALLRRVAARALARDAERPDAARPALRDEDPTVRIHAAGGILAASN